MRTATFESTVDILVKAYMNDTLVHGKCHACAVGNLIASRLGYEVVSGSGWVGPDGERVITRWDYVFCCDVPTKSKFQSVNPEAYCGCAKEQIDSTGYSWQDLAKIEKAFEKQSGEHTGNANNDEAMFNGLMAVVDVLASIHNVDLSIKENAKLLFVKSPN